MALRRAPMIGREHLLVSLREAVAESHSGHPAVVLVSGEAGIGKTRLIAELLAELDEHPTAEAPFVLRGSCSTADRTDVPWGPFLDVLRDVRHALGTEEFLRLAGHRAPEVSVLDPGIPVASPPDAPVEGRLLRVLSGLLLDVAADHPTLLVIEDLQWADEGSRRVLEYVVRSLRRQPLTVVLTVRTEETGRHDVSGIVAELERAARVSRLQPSRLDRDQIALQLAFLCGTPPEPEVLDQVVQLSAGLPLYVEEVAAVLQSEGDLSQMSGRLHGHRLAGLPADALAVVETAALSAMPPAADHVLAASALPGSAFDAALERAVEAGVLVRRGPVLEFRHAVLREATLELLLPHRERELHRRWAEVLEPEAEGLETAVTVARHCIAAGESSTALAACVRAADVAGRASGFSVQLEMLDEVARLWPQVDGAEEIAGRDLIDVLAQAAEAASYASADAVRTRALAARAAGLLTADAAPARRAWLDLLVLRCRYSEAEPIAVAELLTVVQDIPSERPTRERVVACVMAAGQLLQAGRPDEAERYAQEGARSAHVLGLAQLEADAASTEALLHVHRGRYDSAVRSAVRARRLADATGDPFARADAWQIMSIVMWHLGDTPAAVESCRIAVDLMGGSRPGPDVRRWAMNLTNLAEGLIEQGEWAEAQEALDRVLALPHLHGRETDFACRLSRHLRLWREGPDPDYVVTGLPENAGTDFETDGLQDLLPGRYTDADISSHHRNLVRARAELRTPLADVRSVQLPEALYNLLGVAARTEADARREQWPDADPDAGAWTIGQVRVLLDLMTPAGPVPEAQDAHTRADLARWADEDDPATWAHVVALWRRVAHPRPLATALLRLGSVEALSGDRQSARAALGEAFQIAERLGSRPLATAVQEMASRHNVRIVSPPRRSGGPTSLTARELEVLRLLAEGASNGEIGEQLFISARTVSVHVSHILDKLGVGSRTAAATVAHKTGLLQPQPEQAAAPRVP